MRPSALSPRHDHPATTARHQVAAPWNLEITVLDQLAERINDYLGILVTKSSGGALGLVSQPLDKSFLAYLVPYRLLQGVQLTQFAFREPCLNGGDGSFARCPPCSCLHLARPNPRGWMAIAEERTLIDTLNIPHLWQGVGVHGRVYERVLAVLLYDDVGGAVGVEVGGHHFSTQS